MVLFSNPKTTEKTHNPPKISIRKPISKTRSKKTKKRKTTTNEVKYTITIAMIIHGCIITTNLNQNYNIDLYNATDNNIDVCEKTIWEFNDEHVNLLKRFRKDDPMPEKKNYFEIAVISFCSFEIVLDALLRCMIFFLVDLCNTDITTLSFAIDSSTFLSLMSLSIAFS